VAVQVTDRRDTGRTTAGGRSTLARAGAVAWQLIGIFLLVVLLGWAAGKLMPVLLPFAIAVMLAALLHPVARWLEARGMSAGVAAGLALLGVLAVVALVLFLVIPPFVSKLTDLGTSVEEGAIQIGRDVAGMSEEEARRALDSARSSLQSGASGVAGNALAGVTSALGALATAVLVLFLGFFLLKDAPAMWRWVLGLVPERHREWVDSTGRDSGRELGVYMRGVVFVATVDAILIGIALIAFGVPLALPLIVLTWFAAFFPVIGAVAAGLAAVLVTLVGVGVVPAIVVGVVIVAVQQLEGNVLYPVVVGSRLHLHAVVVLLAVAAGGTIAGIAGAFLAVPFATVAATVLRHARHRVT
jgi:putative heme transporter